MRASSNARQPGARHLLSGFDPRGKAMFSGIEITSLYLLLINADLGVDEAGKGLIMRASFAETTLCVSGPKW